MESPSSRRAWIEIFRALSSSTAAMVALLAEGVDRNWMLEHRIQKREKVALLAEGVDRNLTAGLWQHGVEVALLAEGVDRNSV